MKPLACAFVFAASAALGLSAAEPVVHVYKRVGDRDLTLQVFTPPGWSAGDRRPALVLFHGGSWTGGAPSQFAPQAAHFAARGMVTVLVRYRLLDKSTSEPPLVCVQDAKSAMRWVRAHAGQLGIDPQRIAAGGGSAGGHLAACTSLIEGLDDPQDDLAVSPKAAALILFNPVFDNGPDQGWGHERVGDLYRQYSPAHNITPAAPPTLVMLGTQDKLIPVAVVERFKAAMDRAGVRCEARFYEGQGHGFFNPGKSENDRSYRETLQAADDFLVSLGWLKPVR